MAAGRSVEIKGSPHMTNNNFTPRVSIISGVVHAGDAISEAVRADLDALDLVARRRRINIDARVFCSNSTVADARMRSVNDWRQVLGDRHFQTSDIYLYHFGFYNDLHETVCFTRRDSTVVHYFHNITPPQYYRKDGEEILHRSFQQIEMFRAADVHLAASALSARQLEKYLGVHAEIVRLFGPNESAHHALRVIRPKQSLNILYCGRFAQSKGIVTLFEALSRVPVDSTSQLFVTLAGMGDFSDQEYLSSLQAMAKHLPQGVFVRFALNVAPDDLSEEFAKADVFVLPSFHEGFGMTVVEAFSYGTPVISSDGGALPEVTAGLALSFHAGDNVALADRLIRFRTSLSQGRVLCDTGDLKADDWASRIRVHASERSRKAYIENATLRFGTWLDSIQAPSVSYLERLENRKGEVFGRWEPPDAADAALLGAMLATQTTALGVNGEADLDPLRVLLKFPFNGEQSDSDVAYWRRELSACSFHAAVRRLADCPEVRNSDARRQSSIFWQAQLVSERHSPIASQNSEDAATRSTEQSAVDLLDRTKGQFEIELLLSAPMEDWDFVREAYRLMLWRDPDPKGFDTYVAALKSGRTTRRAVVESMLRSPERSVKQEGESINPKAILQEKRDASNSDFLRTAYSIILDREPDVEGFRTYITALDTGRLTRKRLLADMLASKERAALLARKKLIGNA